MDWEDDFCLCCVVFHQNSLKSFKLKSFASSFISIMAYNAWNSNPNTPNNSQMGGWDGSGDMTPLDDGQRSSPPVGMHPPSYPGQFGAPPPGQPPCSSQPGRFGELQQRVMSTISPEDIVILRECEKESLFYRCKYSIFLS